MIALYPKGFRIYYEFFTLKSSEFIMNSLPSTVDGNTAGVAYMIGYTIGRKINRYNRRNYKNNK